MHCKFVTRTDSNNNSVFYAQSGLCPDAPMILSSVYPQTWLKASSYADFFLAVLLSSFGHDLYLWTWTWILPIISISWAFLIDVSASLLKRFTSVRACAPTQSHLLLVTNYTCPLGTIFWGVQRLRLFFSLILKVYLSSWWSLCTFFLKIVQQ